MYRVQGDWKSWKNLSKYNLDLTPISVAARYKVLVYTRSIVGIAGSNHEGAWMSVSCDYCVFSDGGPCKGLITRPEEFYRLLSVFLW